MRLSALKREGKQLHGQGLLFRGDLKAHLIEEGKISSALMKRY